MRRTQAKTLTTRAQIGVGVLAVAAVALVALPMPWSDAATRVARYKERPVGARRAVTPSAIPLEPAAVAASLEAIALDIGREKPPPPPPDLGKPPAVEPPPAAPATVWEYIGGLIGPSVRKAIITLNGEQKMLAEGDTHDGTRINAITADFIMVQKDGKETRIDRKNKRERLAASPMPTPGMGASGKPLPNSGAAAALAARNARLAGQSKEPQAEESNDPRSKHRQLYAEAMRSNNNQPLDKDMRAKYGLDDFEPTDEDMEQIYRQLKEEPQRDPTLDDGR